MLLLAAIRHGHFGVPVFTVISGYCVTATADLRSLEQEPIARYFHRRLRRIFPPYWAAVALQAIFVIAIDVWLAPGFLSTARPRISRPDELTFSQWIGNLTLTESWRFHGAPMLGDADRRYFLGQAWTLCYEEQFYVVVGILLACFGRWPRIFSPLRWCGTIAYSLYLVHVPIVRGLSRSVFDAGWTSADATVFVVCPLAVTAAIAAAWPFHVVIERRFMNRVRR